MSKAEKFIQEHTRNCSNLMQVPTLDDKGNVVPQAHLWLTPNEARKAVEIAREEMIENVCSFIADNISEYIELKHANPTTFIEIDGDRFTNDLKQAMKDE